MIIGGSIPQKLVFQKKKRSKWAMEMIHFIEVRRAVNSKFHIFEEYEAEKDGVEQNHLLNRAKIDFGS